MSATIAAVAKGIAAAPSLCPPPPRPVLRQPLPLSTMFLQRQRPGPSDAKPTAASTQAKNSVTTTPEGSNKAATCLIFQVSVASIDSLVFLPATTLRRRRCSPPSASEAPSPWRSGPRLLGWTPAIAPGCQRRRRRHPCYRGRRQWRRRRRRRRRRPRRPRRNLTTALCSVLSDVSNDSSSNSPRSTTSFPVRLLPLQTVVARPPIRTSACTRTNAGSDKGNKYLGNRMCDKYLSKAFKVL